jgi:hypothetical protein
MKSEDIKIKIKFAGVNDNYQRCYVTEQGSYLAEINGEFYALNQCLEEGFIGIEGEPDFKVDKNKLEIVENF